MKLSIVLSTQQTQFQAASFSGSLAKNVADIAALGYDGVELAIRDPRLVDVDALDALTREHGLRVPAIGTGQAWNEEKLSFTDPDESVRRAAIERVKAHVPVAARFNAVIIIGLLRGIIKPGITQEQGMTWVCEALQECSQAAKPLSVRLALEPINRYETTLVNSVTEGMALIERVGAENFGLLLDTFHMNIEEPDILESISICGERIFHFHVADSNRWYPGAGHLDFPAILSNLKSTGYQGFVSGEFMPLPDPLTAARENIAHLRGILTDPGLGYNPGTHL
jgi:sugar phosphate isomerase/epimerase